MRDKIVSTMADFLNKYGYKYNMNPVRKIADEFLHQKEGLMELFSKHPNYDGKFKIVFEKDYEREVDKYAVEKFVEWMIRSIKPEPAKYNGMTYDEFIAWVCEAMRDNPQKAMEESERIKEWIIENEVKRVNGVICTRESVGRAERIKDATKMFYEQFTPVLKDDDVRFLNDMLPELKLHRGEKTSRVIRKIAKIAGICDTPEWYKKFPVYGDSINPMKIKRFTVISVDPIDYLSMSFGNTWSSCHTTDRFNIRGANHSYRGESVSGTMSYMLDKVSFVFYTVDRNGNADKLEYEDKIHRCMFHYDNGVLIQGRVYPQENDGYSDLYDEYRKIVQEQLAICLGVGNLWSLERGTDACSRNIITRGTHYPDYVYKDKCNVSKVKGWDTPYTRVVIGANPICTICGERHGVSSSLYCEPCCDRSYYCDSCGERYYLNDLFCQDDKKKCHDCMR